MFLIQLAVTAVIVHILSDRNARRALHPINQMLQIAAGQQPEIPKASMTIAQWSFWIAVLSGLAGVWSL